MSTQHTPGRLTLELVESDTGTIKHLCPVDAEGMSLLTVVDYGEKKFAAVYIDHDARRLVAAWNACEGIDTETLETTGGAAVGWIRTASKLLHATKQRDELATQLEAGKAVWHQDQQRVTELITQRDELLAALKAFSNYVQSEQCATDGAVSYSTTAINHWAFIARAAIQKVEAKGGK